MMTNATVVGVPGRVTRVMGQKVPAPSEELDQIHMPDVVAQEICRLMHRIQKLESEVFEEKAGAPAEVGGKKCNEEDK
jgi:serine O-acetyltransferase